MSATTSAATTKETADHGLPKYLRLRAALFLCHHDPQYDCTSSYSPAKTSEVVVHAAERRVVVHAAAFSEAGEELGVDTNLRQTHSNALERAAKSST